GAAFAVRLAFSLWSMRHVPTALGDEFSYWYYGNQMAHLHGYVGYDFVPQGNTYGVVSSHVASSYYPVGWPALLGVVYWIGLHVPLLDNQPKLTAVLQTVMSTGTVALVYFIARKAFNHRVAIIAAVIIAAFPSLIAEVGTYSLETAFIFFMLIALAIVVDHDWASGPMSRKRLLWFGVALGWSATVRPFSLPLLVGIVVAVWCAGRGWREVVRSLGWTAITLMLVLLPWTVRNEVRFHRIIPFSNNLGDTMCLSRYVGSNGGFAWSDHPGCADPHLPEAIRNTANIKAAVHFVLDHPREELRQTPLRFRLMMNNDHALFDEVESNGSQITFTGAWRTAVHQTADWYFRIVWILSLAGLGLMFRGWRKDRLLGPRRALIAIPALFLLLIPIELWGNPRFHVPVLPFMAMAAAAGISSAVDRWIHRGRTRPGDPVPPVESDDYEGVVPGGAMKTAVG
ncbi:MAG TPA: phospholipid carrier-dependent glycosyltransferase, partial [Ilumatobacteraceae bacterium]